MDEEERMRMEDGGEDADAGKEAKIRLEGKAKKRAWLEREATTWLRAELLRRRPH